MCRSASFLKKKVKHKVVKNMKIGKSIMMSCAHFLRDYKGKCANVHGHTYKIEVILDGEVKDGFVMDFYDLKEIMEQEVFKPYDHKLLNEVAPFDKINPTAENISFEFARRIKLRTKIDTTVRVYESPTSWAEARAE